MTDAELQDALRYWQRRLRLRDWHVIAETAHLADMDDAVGDTEFYWGSKRARIRIVPEQEYGVKRIPYSTVDGEEETLVHELLHLHFAGFAATSGSPKEALQHQAVNAIASALIEEHRTVEA